MIQFDPPRSEMFRTEGNDLCKSDGQTGLSAARLALSLSVKTDGGGGKGTLSEALHLLSNKEWAEYRDWLKGGPQVA